MRAVVDANWFNIRWLSFLPMAVALPATSCGRWLRRPVVHIRECARGLSTGRKQCGQAGGGSRSFAVVVGARRYAGPGGRPRGGGPGSARPNAPRPPSPGHLRRAARAKRRPGDRLRRNSGSASATAGFSVAAQRTISPGSLAISADPGSSCRISRPRKPRRISARRPPVPHQEPAAQPPRSPRRRPRSTAHNRSSSPVPPAPRPPARSARQHPAAGVRRSSPR